MVCFGSTPQGHSHAFQPLESPKECKDFQDGESKDCKPTQPSQLLDSHTAPKDLLDSLAHSAQWLALLHFRKNTSLIRKNSAFFLAKNGAKDPYAELQATLTLKNENPQKFFCAYPARALYLANFFKDITDDSKNIQCDGFEEFKQIVAFDKVSLHYAAESDIYPGSAMGHIYLALEGKTKRDITKQWGDTRLTLKKGQYVGYSMSFFTNAELGLNPLTYIHAITGSLDGIYALSPLKNAEFEYLKNEKRNLWKLELVLSDAEKTMLQAHLWELKDIEIDYAFITHNCNDALRSILRVANEEFYTSQNKPYQTPIEYIQSLNAIGRIADVSMQAPKEKEAFIKAYGRNDIFGVRKSAKISLSYESRNHNDYVGIYFAPIYSDIHNVNNAYQELIESRLTSIDVRANLYTHSAFIQKIEVMHLFSLLDFYRSKSLSKYIDVSFENPIYESTRTNLKPNIALGMGFGSYIGRHISIYALPIVGYDYVWQHNAYIDMRVGAVLRFEKIRFVGSYDYYVDIHNQRTYNQSASAFVGINIYKQSDAFIKATIKGEKYGALQVGVSVNF